MNDLLKLMHDTMGKTANIKGSVNLLKKHYGINQDGQKLLDIIEKQANELNLVLDKYYTENKKTMNEVDFSGFTRTEENLKRIKTDPAYRRSAHVKRLWSALMQRRWSYFNWWNIKGFLFNETKQF